MPPELVNAITKQLSYLQQSACILQSIHAVAGGDINEAYRLDTSCGQFFVKTHAAAPADLFEAEYAGLTCLSHYGIIRCPAIVCLGDCNHHHYIVMEHIAMGRHPDEARLGRQLAQLHQVSARTNNAPFQPRNTTPYGFTLDNYIGLTPQSNTPSATWGDFWISQRLEKQLSRARDNGHNALKPWITTAINACATILKDHRPPASVLHGDLWSGNKGYLRHSEPVIYDPATYFGDRETDLALTHLFGGFTADFYRAYVEEWPLEDAFERRKPVYNLYHQLNHLNLFGKAYLNSCIHTIQLLEKTAANDY